MLQSYIDHLVVTAPTLDSGVNYVKQKLGISPQAGGEHIQMGTHNALLKLGAELYLEVIAINPELTTPNRPRWFSIDAVRSSQPKLRTWVARTNDIHAANEFFKSDTIENMTRGEFNWLIGLTNDGSLLNDGIAPLLIQWLSASHPATKLSDTGCSLVQLRGFHLAPDKIENLLNSIGFTGDFSVTKIDRSESPYLTASIQTPNGIVELD